jgi:uncharacterized cupredoxin-like copper-binding protein
MSSGRANLHMLVAVGVAVIVLAGASTVALGAANGAFRHGWVAPNGRCAAPALTGAIIDAELTNMGGPMMAGPMMGGGTVGGTMRVLTNRSSVPAGTVSFRVANTGSLVHEFVVLPLPAGQSVGSRAVGTDGRVDETGSVAEASRTCGSGAGDGINPGSISWVSVTLSPGDYELVCNLPGHYPAGMYTSLTVS